MRKPESIMESWAVTRLLLALNLKFCLIDGCFLNISLVVLGAGRKWNTVCSTSVDQLLLKLQFCNFLIILFGGFLFSSPQLQTSISTTQSSEAAVPD